MSLQVFVKLVGHNDDEESLVCISAVPNEFVGPSAPPSLCAFTTVPHILAITIMEVCLKGKGFRSVDNDFDHQCDGAAGCANDDHINHHDHATNNEYPRFITIFEQSTHHFRCEVTIVTLSAPQSSRV